MYVYRKYPPRIVVAFAAATSLSVIASAQDATPPSFKASPSVYKLIAEDENFRVILAAWQPGQRDEWHSHQPAAVYSLSGCGGQRLYTPDGKYVERKSAIGQVTLNKAIASHSFENRSSKECQALIVERK